MTENVRQLLLMRHAKSDWDDPSLTDHQRPLNRRGRQAADQMAHWFLEHGGPPDLILSSDARRTTETVQRMQNLWDPQIPVYYSGNLYLAAPESILRQIRTDAGDAKRLLVVAHNPGLEQWVNRIAKQPQSFPTAAIACIEIAASIPWDELGWTTEMHLQKIVRPKDGDD